MNKIIILLCIVAFVYSCKKETNRVKSPDNPTDTAKLARLKDISITGTVSAYDFVEMSDGSLIVLTDSGTFFTGTYLQLAKLNADGNLVWKKTIPPGYSGNYAYSIQKDKDENLIINSAVGDGAWIIKTDKNGVKLWDKIISGVTHEGDYGQGNCVVTSSGDIALLYNPSEGNEQNCLLELISANGNTIKSLPIPGIVYAGELKLSSENKLVIAGANLNTSKTATKMVIVTTDLTGNILTSKETSSLSGSQLLYGITEAKHMLYVSGHFTSDTSAHRNFLFGKFSLNGDFVKMTSFGRNFDDVGLCIQALDNNYLVVGGYSQINQSYDLTGALYFSILDTDGNVKIKEDLGGNGRILSLKKSSNNTFWVLGSGTSSGYRILKYSYN